MRIWTIRCSAAHGLDLIADAGPGRSTVSREPRRDVAIELDEQIRASRAFQPSTSVARRSSGSCSRTTIAASSNACSGARRADDRVVVLGR